MKQYTLYQYQLTGATPVEISVGDYTLSCQFTWPQVIQDQVNILNTRIQGMSTGDPLLGNNTIDRDYDYLDYYMNIPDFGAGMEEWWAEQTVKPSSLIHISDIAVYQLLVERKTLAEGLYNYMQDLNDMLHYTATITDNLGTITVCPVIPGAWYRNQDDNWSLRFTAEMDNIGQEDLPRTLVEVETYEYI